MIYIAGTNLFGKCDVVPKKFFVATNFVHVFFLPLIPMGTYLVREDDFNWLSGEFKGIPLPWFSPKSWAFAWLRVALIVIAVVTSGKYIGALLDYVRYDLYWGRADAPVRFPEMRTALILLGSLAGLWLLRVFSRASKSRALALGKLLDIERDDVLLAMRGK